jgi:hypothetical protein
MHNGYDHKQIDIQKIAEQNFEADFDLVLRVNYKVYDLHNEIYHPIRAGG